MLCQKGPTFAKAFFSLRGCLPFLFDSRNGPCLPARVNPGWLTSSRWRISFVRSDKLLRPPLSSDPASASYFFPTAGSFLARVFSFAPGKSAPSFTGRPLGRQPSGGNPLRCHAEYLFGTPDPYLSLPSPLLVDLSMIFSITPALAPMLAH